MYPERLLPNRTRVDLINPCGQCKLYRFIDDFNDLYDEDGEVNLSAIKFGAAELSSLFSSNYVSCEVDSHKISSEPKDVTIIIDPSQRKFEYTVWQEDTVVPNPKEIKFTYENSRGWYFIHFSDLFIEGYFPMDSGKKGQAYKISPVHTPNLINVFHFQVEIYINNKPSTKFDDRLQWVNILISKLKQQLENKVFTDFKL